MDDAMTGTISKPFKTKNMKKIILASTILLAAQMLHAEDKQTPVSTTPPVKNADCTVSMKGKLDLGPVEAEVTCTVTSTSCEEATVKAYACVKNAIRVTTNLAL
jgi:hypothetical protein